MRLSASTRIWLVTCVITGLVAASVGLLPAMPAQASLSFSNIQAANIDDNSATIVWDTSAADTGSVKYGNSCGSLTSSVAASTSATFHTVTLTGLAGATAYDFQIVAGDGVTTSTCQPFTTVLASLVPLTPIVVVGNLTTGGSCNTPLTSGIVLITDKNGSSSSTAILAPVNSGGGLDGTYAGYFSPAAASGASSWFAPAAGDTITVTGDAGGGETNVTTIWDGSSNPVIMPALCVPSAPQPRVSRLTPTPAGASTATPSSIGGRQSRLTPTATPFGNPTPTPTAVSGRGPRTPSTRLVKRRTLRRHVVDGSLPRRV